MGFDTFPYTRGTRPGVGDGSGRVNRGSLGGFGIGGELGGRVGELV